MKLFFTTIFVCFITVCFSQGSFRTGIIAQSENIGTGSDLTQLNDSSYVAVGDVGSQENIKLCVAKLNTSGVMTAFKVLEAPTSGNSIVNSSDGRFVIGGSKSDTVIIIKYDTDMVVQWYKKYTIPNSSYSSVSKIQKTSDGGYITVMSFTIVNSWLSSTIITGVVKLDAKGDILWSKQYALPAIRVAEIRNLPDGNYVFTGTYGITVSQGGISYPEEQGSFVGKIDTAGNMIWFKKMIAPAFYYVPRTLLVDTKGNILFCGSNRYIDSADSQFALSKFDSSGNYLWTKRSNHTSPVETTAWSLAEDKDKGYIVAGSIDNFEDTSGTYKYHNYIMKTDSSGNLQWTKVFALDDVCQFLSIINTKDGGYAASGIGGKAYNDTYGAIHKFTPDFKSCTEPYSYGSLSNIAITVASDTVTVSNVAIETSNTAVTTTSSTGIFIDLCNNVLPVHLLSFIAVLQSNNKVAIEWKTTNEVNADYFIVQRSNTTVSFKDLQQVKASGKGDIIKTYDIVDNVPLAGTSYYRLKQVDRDGKRTYSSVVPVTMKSNKTIVIAPNPVYNRINVKMQSSTSGKGVMQITDLTGKVLARQQVTTTKGLNNVSLPANSLAKGIYLLKIIETDGETITLKFVKE